MCKIWNVTSENILESIIAISPCLYQLYNVSSMIYDIYDIYLFIYLAL